LNTNVLEPADEYKGDIARSYFGTMVKWAGEWVFNLNENGRVIFDATIDADTHYAAENNYGLTDYGLAMLLKWHRQDPVSQKEVDRNNAIQKTQGNRNPFIDYPYLVEYIWGEQSGKVVDMDALLCSADVRFDLDVSNGYLGEAVQVVTDTVFWMVGDDVYTISVVRHGEALRTLPQAPAACSDISILFMGWTTQPMSATSNAAPNTLYTKVADFSAISTNTRYYAVFAQKISTGVKNEVIALTKSDSTNWTITNVKQTSNQTDGAYWLLVKNASITSPVVDLQTLDSVVVKMRSYQSKKALSISVAGESITQLTAATNTMQYYVWSAPELTGNHSLTFIGTDGTAAYGVGIKEIKLYLGGGESTYTNYLTHCKQGTPTHITTTPPTATKHKIMRQGRLYVQVADHLYDSMGRAVN
jgi:hypothetical protein